MLQRFTKRRKLLTATMLLCFCAFTNTAMGQTWHIGHPGRNSNVKATLSGNTLTISGTGDMIDFWDSDAGWDAGVGQNVCAGEAPWGCSATYRNVIQTVIIQNGVTNIGNRAFKGCNNLRTITIPSSVRIIGRQAFFNCTNPNLHIKIPNSVNEVEGEAFRSCSGTLEIESGDTQLNFTGFNYQGNEYSKGWKYGWFMDSQIKTLYAGRNYPDNSWLGANAPFRGMFYLQTLTIGNKVTSIGVNAFADCTNLANVIIEDGPSDLNFIPNGLTGNYFDGSRIETLYLGRNLKDERHSFYPTMEPFAGKTSLIKLTIGSNVRKINSFTFHNCSWLTTITSLNSTPPIIGFIQYGHHYKAFEGVNKTTCKLIVPTGSENAYKVADEWKEFFGTNSLNKVVAKQLQIFPNPVKHELRIESGELRIEKVEIADLTGKSLSTVNYTSSIIDVSAFSSGIYLLKVYTDKGVAVSKIVKE